METTLEYLSSGGNRHPSAADWDPASGLLAYGSGRNIAIWAPNDPEAYGVRTLLKGHTDSVNSVQFLPVVAGISPILLSGSADTTVRVWRASTTEPYGFDHVTTLQGHAGSVNCIATVQGSDVVVTGAVDGCLKVWLITHTKDSVDQQLIQTLTLEPRYFPLCLGLYRSTERGDMILAVGGTKSIIQIYAATAAESFTTGFDYKVALTGHEGWIRSLEFVSRHATSRNDVLLASASQDKYIRLWRLQATSEAIIDGAGGDLVPEAKSTLILSNKAHGFAVATSMYSLSFEALLLGHEDWIYTAKWRNHGDGLQLLSASADNSLAIWEADPSSGVWICKNRLGEISAQKGSTTATGSSGGFWIGLWSPDGASVVSLGRTGSWRRWQQDEPTGLWQEQLGLSGHIKDAKGIAWSRYGNYLLSSSTDQTTRLHGLWERDNARSWHELSRPQIHGYDINCVAITKESQFVSGAEEKLLRVFDEPRQVAELISRLSGNSTVGSEVLPETANMPVLGLSNKAVETVEDEDDEGAHGDGRPVPSSSADTNPFHSRPPTEDVLSKQSLWPEREKLYGHGYEISALSCSHDGTIVATACKASSLEHAVVRLYDTEQWREIKPALTAHSLTVNGLDFSDDDELLLSVGRDRQWSVFARDPSDQTKYQQASSNPKGHTRMILGGAWAPSSFGRIFATAARDKSVKIWAEDNSEFASKASLATTAAATDISFLQTACGDYYILAVGLESGSMSVHTVHRTNFQIVESFNLADSLCPALAINQLEWRPVRREACAEKQIQNSTDFTIAVASEDSSIRIIAVRLKDC